MTEGDRMLIRAIDRALVRHPLICPLPVDLGVGGGHGDGFARRRAGARDPAATNGPRPARSAPAADGAGSGAVSAKDETRMNAIAEAVAKGATLPAAYRKAGVSAIAGRALWSRICARLGVPVEGDAK